MEIVIRRFETVCAYIETNPLLADCQRQIHFTWKLQVLRRSQSVLAQVPVENTGWPKSQ